MSSGDLARELAEMGFEPVETVWLRAWRMNSPDAPIIVERVAGAGLDGRPQRRKREVF